MHTTVHSLLSLVNSHVSKHVKITGVKMVRKSLIKTPLLQELITKTASVKVYAPSEVEHVQMMW